MESLRLLELLTIKEEFENSNLKAVYPNGISDDDALGMIFSNWIDIGGDKPALTGKRNKGWKIFENIRCYYERLT